MEDDFKSVRIPPKRKKQKVLEVCNIKRKQDAPDIRCPICQFPFIEMKGKEKLTHLEDCKGAKEDAEECTEDLNCQETNIHHFSSFSHFKLALSRSQNQTKLANSNINFHSASTNVSLDVSSKKKRKIPESNVTVSDNLSYNFIGRVIYNEEIVTSKTLSVNYGFLNISCGICDKSQNGLANTFKPYVDMSFSPEIKDKECISTVVQCPVLLNIIYNELGWKKISVDFLSGFAVREFELKMGNCCHFVEMKCVLGKENILPDNNHLNPKTLVCFDFNCLGFNTCLSAERSIVEKLWFNYEADNTGAKEKIVNTESSSSEMLCNDICTYNTSTCTASVEDYGNEVLELSSVTELKRNESKEKWKYLFKKKNTSDTCSTNTTYPSAFEMKPRTSAKICPHYKRIPETTFAVDAFQYGVIHGVSHYFLTHFHSDHYCGLTKNFKQRIICSSATGALAMKKLYVERKYLYFVKHMESFTIGKVKITPLDANHCPGSFMFLFQLDTGSCYLHVGDFRANSEMETYPAFSGIKVDALYLDTTYCNPRYEFPTQEDVVEGVIHISLKRVNLEPATLIVSGTYTIGKEKVFMGIANALNSNIWAPKTKRDVLKCLKDENLISKLVEHPCKARVHVWPMTNLNHEALEQHLRDCNKVFKHVLAFNPSGWNFRKKCTIEDIPQHTRGNVTIISVPYSEHSSYSELRKFVKFVKPGKVVPTVSSRNQSFSATTECCTKWLTEPDEKVVPDRQQKLTSFFTADQL